MTRLRDREADTATAVLLGARRSGGIVALLEIEERLKIQDSWLFIKVKFSQSR